MIQTGATYLKHGYLLHGLQADIEQGDLLSEAHDIPVLHRRAASLVPERPPLAVLKLLLQLRQRPQVLAPLRKHGEEHND